MTKKQKIAFICLVVLLSAVNVWQYLISRHLYYTIIDYHNVDFDELTETRKAFAQVMEDDRKELKKLGGANQGTMLAIDGLEKRIEALEDSVKNRKH